MSQTDSTQEKKIRLSPEAEERRARLKELQKEFFAEGGGDEPPVLDEDDERSLDAVWKKARDKRDK